MRQMRRNSVWNVIGHANVMHLVVATARNVQFRVLVWDAGENAGVHHATWTLKKAQRRPDAELQEE